MISIQATRQTGEAAALNARELLQQQFPATPSAYLRRCVIVAKRRAIWTALLEKTWLLSSKDIVSLL